MFPYGDDWEKLKLRVWRRDELRGLLLAILMLFSGRLRSRSSLLSDWTRGLVGGLYTKLEENDDDSDEVPEGLNTSRR